jgi:hypothetical protein
VPCMRYIIPTLTPYSVEGRRDGSGVMEVFLLLPTPLSSPTSIDRSSSTVSSIVFRRRSMVAVTKGRTQSSCYRRVSVVESRC